MKKFAAVLLLSFTFSPLAFADGEVVCTFGNSQNWASPSEINERIKKLESQGYRVSVSAPVLMASNRNNDDRLCVTLNY